MKCIVVYQVMEMKIIPQISFKINMSLFNRFFRAKFNRSFHILIGLHSIPSGHFYTSLFFIHSFLHTLHRTNMLTNHDPLPEIINTLNEAMSETYKLIVHLEPLVGNQCPLVQKLKRNIFNKISEVKMELIDYEESQDKNITQLKQFLIFE